jgi:lipid II:glycine glycyltransferase (peptidoglycan interpeptide bridge formation enzyme)
LEVTAGGIADLPAFVDLYASTVERLKREKKDTDLGDVPKERLVAALGKLVAADRGRLYLVGNDGKSVAGCFFGVSRASAFYLFNGSTEAALQTGGTPLIMLRALTALSEAGVSRINLGGVPATAADPASPDHGLYTFKRGLGGEPVVCHGGQVQVRPVRATLFDLAKQIRKQLRG